MAVAVGPGETGLRVSSRGTTQASREPGRSRSSRCYSLLHRSEGEARVGERVKREQVRVRTCQPGASNRAAETAAATCQAGTPTEDLADTAAAAAVTAATASAHLDPGGRGSTGCASARVRRVNTTRTCSTRAPKRRNSRAPSRAGVPAASGRSAAPPPNAACAGRRSHSTAPLMRGGAVGLLSAAVRGDLPLAAAVLRWRPGEVRTGSCCGRCCLRWCRTRSAPCERRRRRSRSR